MNTSPKRLLFINNKGASTISSLTLISLIMSACIVQEPASYPELEVESPGPRAQAGGMSGTEEPDAPSEPETPPVITPEPVSCMSDQLCADEGFCYEDEQGNCFVTNESCQQSTACRVEERCFAAQQPYFCTSADYVCDGYEYRGLFFQCSGIDLCSSNYEITTVAICAQCFHENGHPEWADSVPSSGVIGHGEEVRSY